VLVLFALRLREMGGMCVRGILGFYYMMSVHCSFAGATKYSGFLQLLKQLVNPLCDQLADRRSSIVKQVLLNNA